MIRVFIGLGAFMPDGVQVAIVNDMPGDGVSEPSRRIARFDSTGLSWEPVEPFAIAAPTFTLTDDMARALMEELTRYYHGADDSRALRRDYDAERKRVDNLIGHLTFIAANLVPGGNGERTAAADPR